MTLLFAVYEMNVCMKKLPKGMPKGRCIAILAILAISGKAQVFSAL